MHFEILLSVKSKIMFYCLIVSFFSIKNIAFPMLSKINYFFGFNLILSFKINSSLTIKI
jgi:hypothetical protein